MPPGPGPGWEKTPEQMEDMLERLGFSSGLGMSRCLPGRDGGSGWGEGGQDISDQTPGELMDGCMHACMDG